MSAFQLAITPRALTLKPGESGAIKVDVSNRLGRPFLGRVDCRVEPRSLALCAIPPAVAQRTFDADPSVSYTFEFFFRAPNDGAAQAAEFRAVVVDPQLTDDPLARSDPVAITLVKSDAVVVPPKKGIRWGVGTAVGVAVLAAGFGIFRIVFPGEELGIVAAGFNVVGCLLVPDCRAENIPIWDLIRQDRDTFQLPGGAHRGVLRLTTFTAVDGSPAEGRHAYLYSMDLDSLASPSICITGIRVPAGTMADDLDFNGDSIVGERIFSEPEGVTRPDRALRKGNTARFEFDPGFCPGARMASFGFFSDRKPDLLSATVMFGREKLKIELEPELRPMH